MTSHVDAETLALSLEGLLDDEEERSVRTHVAGCSQCAETREALGEVSGLLAEEPVPPLPDSVSARLDEAIRAERKDPTSDGGTPSAAEGDGNDRDGRQDRGDAEDPDGPGGVDGDAAEELRSRAAEVVPMRRRGVARWMPYIAAAAAAVFVIGGGAALLRGMGDEPGVGGGGETRDDEPHAVKEPAPVLVESGTAYTPEGLEGQAGDVLSLAAPELPPQGAESDEEAPEISALPSPSENPSGVSTCVEGLTEEGERTPLVDVATYTGDGGAAEPVWVLYTEEASGSYTVSVVSPECTGGAPADAVLDSAPVPAP
ncbi:anti-sigma factor family protein [Nocardiopsis suaedae]|uniref:Zinc-finger domain-containing protein n=1 Tax=Nocardiopsis suaedae TaxID=3018444 RepID=A0ABT4TTM5_9ACTN|nr:hypothetical protein [Nocardiopsis suaedae]MDA2808037.1 hypothetical protein [Nocardiopsis suaedae]